MDNLESLKKQTDTFFDKACQLLDGLASSHLTSSRTY